MKLLQKIFFYIVCSISITLATSTISFAQGEDCASAQPFCSDIVYDFPNLTDVPHISGPNYGCLTRAPNAAWYYMKVGESGNIKLEILQTSEQNGEGDSLDVDFAMWGPFDEAYGGCEDIMSRRINPIQSSYDYSSVEFIGLGVTGGGVMCGGSEPSAAVVGQYYVVIITNFSDDEGFITLKQTNKDDPNAGATDCSIVTGDIPDLGGGGGGGGGGGDDVFKDCEEESVVFKSSITFSAALDQGELHIVSNCDTDTVKILPPFPKKPTKYDFSIHVGAPDGSECEIRAYFTELSNAEKTLVIKKPIIPELADIEITPATCVDTSIGVIVNYNPDYLYTISPRAGAYIESTGLIKDTLPGTTYTISVSDKTCKEGSVTFTTEFPIEHPAPKTVGNEVCNLLPHTVLTAEGENIRWYKDEELSEMLFEGTEFTPDSYEISTYYATQTIKGCESEPTSTNYKIKPIPEFPSILAPDSVCSNQKSFNLTTQATTNITWYSFAHEDSIISSNRTLHHTLEQTSGTITFYARQNVQGCFSGFEEKEVTIVQSPEPPILGDTIEACVLSTLEALTAIGQNIKWYNKAGTLLPEASTPSTASVGLTSYYATQTVEGCESHKSEQVIRIIATPKPIVVSPIAYCRLEEDIPELTAEGSSLMWYSTADAEVGVADAPTPPTDNDTTLYYYVSQHDGKCESQKEKISVLIKPLPESYLQADTLEYCGTTSSVELEVLPLGEANLTNASYAWYKDEELLSHTGSELQHGVVAGEYKVVAQLNNCTYETNSLTIIQHDNPTYTISGAAIYCPETVVKDNIVITFSAQAPFSFHESMTGDVHNYESMTYHISMPDSGTYFIDYIKDSNGCELTVKTEEVVVTTLPTPELIINSITNVCDKSVETIHVADAVQGIGTFEYTTNKGSISEQGILTLDGAGDYIVRIDITGLDAPYCINDGEAKFTVYELPTVQIVPEIVELCEDADISFTAVPSGGAGDYTSYSWSGSAAQYLDDIHTAAPIFSGAVANTYQAEVLLTDTNNCTAQAQRLIKAHHVPIVSLSASTLEHCVSEELPQEIIAAILPDTLAGIGSWSYHVQKRTERTAEFIPHSAGTDNSPHTIAFTYTSDFGCLSDTAEISITVHPLPVVTIEVDNKDVCLTGNNSAIVGMITTNTEKGTSVFSSPTAIINEQTGALDPTVVENQPTYPNTVVQHTIRIDYTDEHTCKTFAETELFVHALPIVSFNDNTPLHVCIYDNDYEFDAYPKALAPATGIFSGAVNSATFSPSTLDVGTHSSTYTYRDEYGCEDSASHSITVLFVEPPIVIEPNPQTIVVEVDDSFKTDPLLTAQGEENHTVFWVENDCETIILEHDSYSPPLTAADLFGEPTYIHSYLVHQVEPIIGCISECSQADVELVRCPAKPPVAYDSYYCVGEEGDITLQAAHVVPPFDGDTLIWFANADKLHELAIGNTFTSTLGTEYARTETLYVVEWNKQYDCYSEVVEVSLHVKDNPTPTISIDPVYCATYGDVAIIANPLGGELVEVSSVGGLNTSTFMWNPMEGGEPKPSKTLKVAYTVTESYIDGKTCSTTVNTEHTSYFMEKPIAHHKNWLIDEIEILPLGHLAATPDGIGETIQWYTSATMDTQLQAAPYSTSATYDAERADLRQIIDPSQNNEFSYWITQSDIHGCESEPEEVKLLMVKCPFEAPVVQPIEGCMLTRIGRLEANSPASNIIPVDEWQWFDSETATNPIYTTSNSYDSQVDNTIDTTFTFYVQYIATEQITQRQCKSPRESVTATILPLPKLAFSESNIYQFCNYDDAQQIGVEVNYNTDGAGTGLWKIEGYDNAITQTGIFNPAFRGETSETYKVKYIYQDAKTCTDSIQTTIAVHYTPVPTTQNYTWITTQPQPVVLKAENLSQSLDSVVWYNSQSSVEELSTNSIFTTDDNPEVAITKSYFVNQVANGCESEREEAVVTLVDCPYTTPPITTDIELCAENTIAPLEALKPANMPEEPTIWNWYANAADAEPIYSSIDGRYNHTINSSEAGEHTFYVNFEAIEPITKQVCSSPRAKVRVTIFQLPEVEISVPDFVCYDSGLQELQAQVATGTNGEGSGQWTVLQENGGIELNSFFNPTFKGEQSGIYTLEYIYTDAKTCVFSQQASIEVHYTPAPTTEDHISMTIANADVKVKATNLISNALIQWYNQDETKIDAPTSQHDVFFTQDPGTIEIPAPGKVYKVTQTVRGCESTLTDARVVIVSCPVPAPQLEAVQSICEYEPDPEIKITPGANWGFGERPDANIPVEYNIYASLTDTIPIAVTTEQIYVPTINKNHVYMVTYYVSEFNKNAYPLACESSRTAVSISVKRILPASLSALPDVCEQPEGTIPTAEAFDYVGELHWFETNEELQHPVLQQSDGVGNTFTPTATTVGVHTVWAVVKVDNCVSKPTKTSFRVKAIPEAPQLSDTAICFEAPHITLTTEGSNIQWYADENRTQIIAEGEEFTPQKYETEMYYATQTVESCESAAAALLYTVHPIPAAPTFAPQNDICIYDASPALEAYGEHIQWYNEDLEHIGYGNTYTAYNTVGAQKFYASQTIHNCTSELGSIQYIVHSEPEIPQVQHAEICEGDASQKLFAAGANIVWYYDFMAEEPIGVKGQEYLPDNGIIKSTSFYVRQEINSCQSAMAEVWLEVIPKPTMSLEDSVLNKCVYELPQIIESRVWPALGNENYVYWQVFLDDSTVATENTEGSSFNPYNYFNSDDTLSRKLHYTIRATYSATAASGKECYSKPTEMYYNVYPRQQQPKLISQAICTGSRIEPLIAEGTDNMLWIAHDDYLLSGVNGTRYDFTSLGIRNIPKGTYDFTLLDFTPEGCQSLDYRNSIFVAPAAEPTIIGDTIACVYSSKNLYSIDSLPELPSVYTWAVTGGNKIRWEGETSDEQFIDWLNSGIDTVTVEETTYYGCKGSDYFIVNVADVPEAHFTWMQPGAESEVWYKDNTTQNNIEEMLPDGSTLTIPITYTMFWDFGKSSAQEFDLEVEHKNRKKYLPVNGYLYGNKYPRLYVINEYGCESEYSEEIFIDLKTDIYVPTAFSPTNPAYSVRFFQPVGFNVAHAELWVYDAWGNLIWYSDEVENGLFMGKWDGTYEGKLLQAGTYIWKMEATLLNNTVWQGIPQEKEKRFSKQGSVVLIR